MKSPIIQTVGARTFAVLAVLAGSACSGSTFVDKPLAVATVEVSPTGALNLNIGTTAQLTATPKGPGGEPMTARTVTWQSTNTAIATVSSSGQVTGVGPGNAQITAKSDSASASVNVVVTAQSRIALSATTLSFAGVAGLVSPGAQTVSITNSGTGTLSNLTVGATQYTAGQLTGWLTTSLAPSTAPSTLTLQAATGALNAGTYTAIVPVVSTPAANSPQNVNVTFVVDPSFLLTIAGAGTGSGTVTFGGNTCTITNGTASGACLQRFANGASVTLTATPTGTSVFAGWSGACTGTAPCVLTMSADRSVTATFNTPPILIALSKSAVTFSTGVGGANPTPQTVNITNGGTGTLTGLAVSPVKYTPGQPINWLTATLTTTTAPANLNLVATTGSLPAATYTATVDVTSPVAGNSPRTDTITFVVVPKLVVATDAATAVVFNGATLNGRVTQTGESYRVYFEYGTNPNLTPPVSTTNEMLGPKAPCPTSCDWSTPVTALTAGRTYYYRIVATNDAGQVKGLIISFITR